MSQKIWLLIGSLTLGTTQIAGCSPEFRTCEVRHVCPAGGASGEGGTAGMGATNAARAGAQSFGSERGGNELSGESGAAGAAGEAGSDVEENGGSAGTPDTLAGGDGNHGGAGASPAAGGTAGVGGTAGSGGAPGLLTNGTICSANSECSSNNCGGRCCPVGKPCSCPQPTAKNSLKNPGFDGNVSGWTVTSSVGSGSFHWVAVDSINLDATACPYSGFGRIFSGGVTTVSQCVAVSTSKSYNVSTAVSNAGGGQIDCNLDWFSGPDCTGSSPLLPDGALHGHWLNFDWSPRDMIGGGPWFPPSGAVSARLSCSDTCDADDGMGPCYANIDQMGIVEAPATY
jgi:hypothetical protein